MKYEDKINEIMVNNKIRSTLKKAGIIPYAGHAGTLALSPTSYDAVLFVSFAQAHY